MRYLVTKVPMELLEICSNLVSSIRHNRFERHFEFGMKPLVSKERGNHGRRVQHVVVCKLSQRKEVDPIVLLVVDVHLKILFQDLVDPFSLAIRLRVIGERLALMPNSWQSNRQKREMKCFPQSETMSVGVPCFAKTCDKNIRARSSASMSRKVGMNRAILVRWHTTTKIVSCPSDRGSPSMKSIEIESQGHSLIGRNQ